MTYETEEFASVLKAVREAKGLSQRALSTKAAVPQSHISKIEKGAVDLRVSSLLALAHVLDLELALIPRKAISAVRAIVRASDTEVVTQTTESARELRLLENAFARFLKSTKSTTGVEITQLQRRLRELKYFQISKSNLEKVKEIRKILLSTNNNQHTEVMIRDALARIGNLRNSLAHESAHAAVTSTIRPAYSLDEENGDA